LTAVLAIIEGGTLALGLLLASFWQATTPAVALPAQARGLAALSELDALIALRAPDLQRQLDEGTDALTIAGFPVRGIAIDRSAAESPQGKLDPAAYRDALLEASASLLYERGLEALRSPDTTAVASDRLIELFLNNLTQDRHEQAGLALVAVLAVVALLKGLLLLAARGYRWLALDLAVALGGAFALVLTLVARGALATLETPPGAALTEYAAVTRTLLDLPQWNALAALALGLALMLPGALGRRRG
jgi:hypothetical protein